MIGDESDEKEDEWNNNRFPAWNSDDEALRAARDDARASLDQTISQIEQIDQTALVTLRISLIITGLILTAVTSVPATFRLGNWISIAGFCLVVLSAAASLVTNMGSDYPTGIGADYLEDFQRASWEQYEWNEWMVREHATWLEDAQEMATGNARALFITQLLLGLGLGLLIIGLLLGGMDLVQPVSPFSGAGNRTVTIGGSVFYVYGL